MSHGPHTGGKTEEKPRWEASGGAVRAELPGQVPESTVNSSPAPAREIPGRRPKMRMGGQWKSPEAATGLCVQENTSRTGRKGMGAL